MGRISNLTLLNCFCTRVHGCRYSWKCNWNILCLKQSTNNSNDKHHINYLYVVDLWEILKAMHYYIYKSSFTTCKPVNQTEQYIIQDVVEYKLNDITLILCLKYEVWQMLGLILLFGIKVVHKTSDFLLQWLCTLLYSSRHNKTDWRR